MPRVLFLVFATCMLLGHSEGSATDKPLDEEKAKAGGLIIDGRLVPGPWKVVVTPDGIEVNGRRPKRGQVPIAVRKTPGVEARFAVISKLQASLGRWLAEGDPAAARVKALAFVRKQSFVKSAELSGALLRVTFKDSVEEHFRIAPTVEEKREPADVRREALGAMADAVRTGLDLGGLVILQHGIVMVLPQPEGGEALAAIRAAAGLQDVAARTKAIAERIPDPDVVRAIAEHFAEGK